MRIRWENILILVVIGALLFAIAKGGSRTRAVVERTFSPISWESPQEQVVNLMIFGLILVLIVAVVALLSRRQ